MRVGIFSVWDEASQAFMQPFFGATDAVAKRAFAEAINNPSAEFFRHFNDYSLFMVGWFDDQTGEITAEHSHLGAGLSFRKPSEKEIAQ